MLLFPVVQCYVYLGTFSLMFAVVENVFATRIHTVVSWSHLAILVKIIRVYTVNHNDHVIANFLLSVLVKEFWNSVNMWQRYAQNFGVFFDSRVYLTSYVTTSGAVINSQIVDYCTGSCYVWCNNFRCSNQRFDCCVSCHFVFRKSHKTAHPEAGLKFFNDVKPSWGLFHRQAQ